MWGGNAPSPNSLEVLSMSFVLQSFVEKRAHTIPRERFTECRALHSAACGEAHTQTARAHSTLKLESARAARRGGGATKKGSKTVRVVRCELKVLKHQTEIKLQLYALKP